jgi:hypothetical protein
MGEMRIAILVLIAACKFAPNATPGTGDDMPVDGSTIGPEPMLSPGGGITGGAIAGRVNVFVIDARSEQPVAGATVGIGGVEGVTDATGLFVALNPGLAGPQTVLVTAPGYRPEQWVGVDGANVTITLTGSPVVTPQATIGGTIAGFQQLGVGAGHFKVAQIGYSQNDAATDGENNLRTPNRTNVCTSQTTADCAFTLTARTGTVMALGAVYDQDTRGNGNPDDDTFTVMTWAYARNVTLADGQMLAGQQLQLVQPADLVTVTTDLGTPPSPNELTSVFGVVGYDLGTAEGVAQAGFTSPQVKSTVVPKRELFGATYRFTSIAMRQDSAAYAIVFRRGNMTTALATGTWLDAPAAPTAMAATGTTIIPVTGAAIQSVKYATDTTELLEILVFDGSTALAVPAGVAIPATGVHADLAAIGATFDVTSFAFDRDREQEFAVTFRRVGVD